MTLQEISDKVSFDLLSKRQPRLIIAIQDTLAKGATAALIEAWAFSRLGGTSMTAAVIAGAAHYLERTHASE